MLFLVVDYLALLQLKHSIVEGPLEFVVHKNRPITATHSQRSNVVKNLMVESAND